MVYTRYKNYPEVVILDVLQLVKEFYEESSKMQDYEHCIDEIFSEIIYYIGDQYRALAGLESFREDIRRCYNGIGCRHDGDILAPPAYALGLAIYRQCLEGGMYDVQGFLVYTPGDWIDLYTPTLKRVPMMF